MFKLDYLTYLHATPRLLSVLILRRPVFKLISMKAGIYARK
jgi:hypothetical protein